MSRLSAGIGIVGEEGSIWEVCSEFWKIGVKSGTKAVVQTTALLPEKKRKAKVQAL